MKLIRRKKEIDLEGALIPMVTLNKIIGSIPILGKILTNERKGIWSFIFILIPFNSTYLTSLSKRGNQVEQGHPIR